MATAGATTNARQLRENLANYEAQLHQVEAALTNDPENEELLKLKTDLSEVKQLTVDLLELAPEPKRKAPNWKAGDTCRAVWSDNGKYYNAVIDVVSEESDTCTLTFEGYGTTVTVKLSDLRPPGGSAEGELQPPGGKRKKVAPRPVANAKEKRAEMREYKKKKALKKKERMHEVEQFREKEKQRWKSFAQKSSKSRGGPINAKQKKSIFAVPDSLEGRVGVGTCNIGGKGMTDFVNPSKTYSVKPS